MTVFRSPADRPAGLPETAVAIGNFDGVHIGHASVIRQAVNLARDRGLAAAVLTFDPHPAAVLNPARAPRLIMTLAQRLAALESLGVQHVFVAPFSVEFAAQTPGEFVDHCLRAALNARIVLVGDDFRFGHDRAGDVATLRQLGLEVHPAAAIGFRGSRASSTGIRTLVAAGNVSRAARFLGRPFTLTGLVVKGQGIGSIQTVPTLNLAPENQLLPADGVYVTCTTDTFTGQRWRSITNIGVRPTFDGAGRTVETFLLDPFSEPAPARIEVAFLRYVRQERKFPTPEDLRAQIFRDVALANRLHRRLQRLQPASSALYACQPCQAAAH
jgi:riboflavin kinase/FMN adenylyltransferase